MANKGHIVTKETREKISLAHKGRHPKSEWKKGNAPWNKGLKNVQNVWNKGKKCSNISLSLTGRKLSNETKQKIRIANLGKHPSEETKLKLSLALRGDKSYMWKGGKSFEPYSFEFNNQLKEQIRKRDSYRCQECFRNQNELFKKEKSGKIIKEKLSIHHIDYNKQNNNQDNLISLCNSCHGQTQFRREDWQKYYQNKIKGGN